MSSSERASIESLESLAHLLDDRFRLPGTRIRFGLDSILGLLPGVGDTATAVVSAYLIGRARRLGVGRWVQLRMVWNVLVDVVIGTIPILGDVFDVGWKANKRNIDLLMRETSRRGAPAGRRTGGSRPSPARQRELGGPRTRRRRSAGPAESVARP